VDTRALHQMLFDDRHVDWDGVQEYLGDIQFTIDEWMRLLSHADFVNEIPSAAPEMIASALSGIRIASSSAAATKPNPLDGWRICFARAKLTPTWDVLCKAFVLCNLVEVDCFAALQALLPPTANIHEIIRHIPSFKHAQSDYTTAFARILQPNVCDVRTHLIERAFEERDARIEQERQKVIRSGMMYQKPSLTAVIQTLHSSSAASDASPASADTFASFCRSCKFAANANRKRKQVAYFIACLPGGGVRYPQELQRTVGNDSIIYEAVVAYKIRTPDLKELRAFVKECNHTGAPCEALSLFRESCIAQSCIIITATGRRTVHWSAILRFYLAAYCRPEVRKDLWGYVLSTSVATAEGSRGLGLHAASEVETAVQTFASEKPLALKDIIELLLEE
jgi:hypothetical protein